MWKLPNFNVLPMLQIDHQKYSTHQAFKYTIVFHCSSAYIMYKVLCRGWGYASLEIHHLRSLVHSGSQDKTCWLFTKGFGGKKGEASPLLPTGPILNFLDRILHDNVLLISYACMLHLLLLIFRMQPCMYVRVKTVICSTNSIVRIVSAGRRLISTCIDYLPHWGEN